MRTQRSVVVTASLVAKTLGITLWSPRFEVQGDLDTAALVRGAEGNADFDRVTVPAVVESDASDRNSPSSSLKPNDGARSRVRQQLDAGAAVLSQTWVAGFNATRTGPAKPLRSDRIGLDRRSHPRGGWRFRAP